MGGVKRGAIANLTPRAGTYVVGIVYFFSSLLSTLTLKLFGRRTLLILGHLLIAIIYALLALFNTQGNHTGVFLMVLAFIFVYSNSTGPVTFVYATETLTDAGLGFGMFVCYITAFILSLVGPVLMGDKSFGLSNVFYMFSVLSAVATVYVWVYIKETQGLKDF